MIAAIKKAARFAWDYLIPRFITEDVGIGVTYRMGNFRKWIES